MAKRMRTTAHSFYSCCHAQALHHLKQARARKRLVAPVRAKEQAIWLPRFLPQIGSQALCCGATEENGTSLVPFAKHGAATASQIHIHQLEACNFTASQPRVQH